MSRHSHIMPHLCHVFWKCFLSYMFLCVFRFVSLSTLSSFPFWRRFRICFSIFSFCFPGFKGPDLGRDPTAAEEQTFEADPGPGQHRAQIFLRKKENKIDQNRTKKKQHRIFFYLFLSMLSKRYSKYTQFAPTLDPFMHMLAYVYTSLS